MRRLARGLGKQTIAEFVEDEETVTLLRTLGVDHAQGHHIARALPLASIAPLGPRTRPGLAAVA